MRTNPQMHLSTSYDIHKTEYNRSITPALKYTMSLSVYASVFRVQMSAT